MQIWGSLGTAGPQRPAHKVLRAGRAPAEGRCTQSGTPAVAAGLQAREFTMYKVDDEGQEQPDGHIESNFEHDCITEGKKNNKSRKRKMKQKYDQGVMQKRGVCYLSRIPHHMDPSSIRHILSEYGDVQRVYLAPAREKAQGQHKKTGGFRNRRYTEGWVEFTKKSAAKNVARTLNGEMIGGKRRSAFYYDTWNIKYLSKFKWDDLIGETVYEKRVREYKMNLLISAAKRERDFYMSKVDQACALKHVQERLKKKQKTSELGSSEDAFDTIKPELDGRFTQEEPVGTAEETKSRLSKDVLRIC